MKEIDQKILLACGMLLCGFVAGRFTVNSRSENTFESQPASNSTLNQTELAEAKDSPFPVIPSTKFTLDATDNAVDAIEPVSFSAAFTDDFNLATIDERVSTLNGNLESGNLETVNREELTELILDLFPSLSAAKVEGWADSYVGLPLSEVRQMLEQRQMMNGIFPTSFTETTADLTAIDQPDSNSNIDWISLNSARATTFGYRQTQLLQLPGSADSLAFTDLTAGPLYTTNRPLDVAIDDTNAQNQNASAWLLLDENRLTRFGRLQLLPDRRIGLLIDNESVPLAGVSLIPADMTVEIDAGGRVYAVNEHGRHACGKICVVQANAQQIQTQDGVIFRIVSGNTNDLDDAKLLIGCLEGSNVPK